MADFFSDTEYLGTDPVVLREQAPQPLVEKPDGVLTRIKPINPQELVAIALQDLLAFYIFRFHIRGKVVFIDILALGEMFFEPVIFDYESFA